MNTTDEHNQKMADLLMDAYALLGEDQRPAVAAWRVRVQQLLATFKARKPFEPAAKGDPVLCIRTSPELGDGTSGSIYESSEIANMADVLRDLIEGGDMQPGEVLTLEVVSMSRAEFDALPEL